VTNKGCISTNVKFYAMEVNTYTVALEANQGHASAMIGELKSLSKKSHVKVNRIKNKLKPEVSLV
jgi:hypothetical protein